MLAKTFGVLLALLILFILEENIRGWIGLHLYLHHLRSQGEKLTLAELELPEPDPKENGAAALMAAASQLHALSRTYPLAAAPPDPMRLVAPGHAQVLWNQPALTGWDSNGAKKVYEWSELSRQLDEAAIPLQRAKEALRKPSLDVELDYSQGLILSLPQLNETRIVARWLVSATLDDLHKRNLDDAITNIAMLASLTRFQKNERVIISQLVRNAVGKMGLGITWEALQTPGWNDSQLARLSEAWAPEQSISDMVRAVEEERTGTLVDFELLRQRHDVLRDQLKYTFDVEWENGNWVQDYSHPFPGKVRLFLASGLWRLLWSYQDEDRALHRRQVFLDAARIVEKRKAWSPFSLPPVTDDCYDRSLRCAMLYFSNMLAGPGSEQTVLRTMSLETQREMTCAAIAIKRYQLRMGKPPPDLGALVPEYLSELPHDWMNGQPLRYRPNGDGTFTLYSVGKDARDNGGDPSFTDRWRKSLWDSRDAVWPSP